MSTGRTVNDRKALAKLKAAWAHVNEKKRSEIDHLEIVIPEPAWADLKAAIDALLGTNGEDE